MRTTVPDTTAAPVRVLLLESIHPDADELLTQAGFEVRSLSRALSEDELIAELPGVALLGIRSKTNVTARVLEAADSLVAIGAFCIGTNQIDVQSASEQGVNVFNAPFSNTRSVVELAIAEIISMTRRLTEKNALMHDGVWDKSADGAHEVRGRTLGIVGYGNIGTQLSVLAENLGHEGALLRHRRPACPRQCAPVRIPAPNCSPRPMSSPCTWTGGSPTTTSSAPPSSRRCGRGRCS